MPEPAAADDRSWALPAAAALLALENAAVLGGVLFVGNAPALVPAFLAAKFPFCVGLLQRRHGAFMLLTLWEAITFVIAIINPALDFAPRLALFASSAAGLTLLGLAINTFPEVHVPPRFHGPDGSPR